MKNKNTINAIDQIMTTATEQGILHLYTENKKYENKMFFV